MLPAVIVGAYTAWYLGLTFGAVIAGIVAVALLAASFVPGMTLTVWGLTIGWCGLLYFFGPTIAKNRGGGGFGGVTGGAVRKATGAWAAVKRRMDGRK